MVTALKGSVVLFRPVREAGYDGKVSYSRHVLSCIKLAQPSKGWSVDTSGAISRVTATLFYNFGISSMEPEAEPLFRAGDIVCAVSAGAVPTEDRLVVESVTEHSFKGELHHYEVVLV